MIPPGAGHRARRFSGIAGTLAGVLLLSACVTNQAVPTPDHVAVAAASAPPSAESRALRDYFLDLQEDLLARGLLRRDGGGPDTPFSPDTLSRNFEVIAFFDEYGASNTEGRLRRWDRPVRVGLEFGPSVDRARQSSDRNEIRSYTRRLARLTDHPITMSRRSNLSDANFTVIVAGIDDRDFVEARLRQLVPGIGRRDLAVFTDPPRSVYCLVVAFSNTGNPYVYDRAVALIRDEHPDLMRRACIQEEMAQGLGLANDSPDARPSIFNDDDEFALLTNHDELLLKMLYDPRLRPGLTAAEARPITRIIAREAMGREL